MIAAHVIYWCSCLPIAMMAATIRGCLILQLQPEGTEEPQTNISIPQQERQLDAAEGKVVADYELDINYQSEGWDPEIEAVHDKEENSDAEYAKMELPGVGTLH